MNKYILWKQATVTADARQDGPLERRPEITPDLTAVWTDRPDGRPCFASFTHSVHPFIMYGRELRPVITTSHVSETGKSVFLTSNYCVNVSSLKGLTFCPVSRQFQQLLYVGWATALAASTATTETAKATETSVNFAASASRRSLDVSPSLTSRPETRHSHERRGPYIYRGDDPCPATPTQTCPQDHAKIVIYWWALPFLCTLCDTKTCPYFCPEMTTRSLLAMTQGWPF